MKIDVKVMPALVSAALGAALASPASAADSDYGSAGDGLTSQEGSPVIVVSANKRSEVAAVVPASVVVLSKGVVERAHVRDLFDITSLVPSLRMEQYDASGQTDFFVRGFGNGDNNVGIEPSVGVFVDGVYRSRAAAEISDLIDVAQIEVLEGPQSTLFGKNASAGVVSISTLEPQFQLGGSLEATVANFGGSIIKGRLTGALTRNLAASLSGTFDRDNGYVINDANGTRIDNRHRWQVRGQLLWTPASDLKVRLIGDYDRINERCCAVVNVASSGATQLLEALGGQVNSPSQVFSDRVDYNYDPTNDIRNWGISGQVDYKLGGLNLVAISALRRTRAISNEDADFSSADLLGNYSQNQRIGTFTQEVRVSGDLTNRLKGLIGLYYFHQNIQQANAIAWGSQMRGYADELIQVESAALGQPTDLGGVEQNLSALTGADLTGHLFGQGQGQSQAYGLRDRSISVFGQTDYKIGAKLTLTGGLNVTRDVQRFSANITSNEVFSSLDLPLIANAAIAGGVPVDQALGLLTLTPLQLMPSVVPVPNSVERGRVSNTNVSWTARAVYAVNSHVNGYVNVSTGFKPSSINLSRDSRPSVADASALVSAGLASAPTVLVAGIPISSSAYGSRFTAPEKTTMFEAGIKTHWDRGGVNVAVFDEVIRDFQSVVFTGTGFDLQNAGKESNWGIEASGMFRPMAHVRLDAAINWYNPRYNRFLNSSVGDLSGHRPAGITPVTINLRGADEIPIGRTGKVVLQANWRFESKTQLVDGFAGEIVRDPITQGVISYGPAIAEAGLFSRKVSEVDASAAYDFGNSFEVSVWARNLTNDRYLLNATDSPAQAGSISGYVNRPRTYGATARVNW